MPCETPTERCNATRDRTHTTHIAPHDRTEGGKERKGGRGIEVAHHRHRHLEDVGVLGLGQKERLDLDHRLALGKTQDAAVHFLHERRTNSNIERGSLCEERGARSEEKGV
jgi:hypothetical protein